MYVQKIKNNNNLIYVNYREAIQEDDGGSLQASVADIVHKAKRKKLAERPINIKLGMVRYFYFIRPPLSKNKCSCLLSGKHDGQSGGQDFFETWGKKF